MAAPNAAKAYLNSGKLAYGCTDLSTAWPHGGTGLGIFASVVLRPPAGHSILMEEESNTPFGVLWRGGPLILAGIARGWDADAQAAIWPSTSTGASGDTVVTWPGTGDTAGEFKTELTNVVFTAENVAQNHPSVVLFNVVAVPDVDVSIPLTAYRFRDFRVAFIATGSDSAQGTMGRIGDLSV